MAATVGRRVWHGVALAALLSAVSVAVALGVAGGGVPVAAQPLEGGPYLDAGGAHTCALTPEGDARCWGFNDSGQAPASVAGPFGPSEPSPSPSPDPSPDPSPSPSPGPSIEEACPQRQVPPSGFGDVAGNVHDRAIGCLVWWQVTTGAAPGRYAPGQRVTRGSRVADDDGNPPERSTGHRCAATRWRRFSPACSTASSTTT